MTEMNLHCKMHMEKADPAYNHFSKIKMRIEKIGNTFAVTA